MTIVQPSAEFKAKATSAIIAILFFIVSYLVLLGLAIALTALSFYIGLKLIFGFTSFWTIIIGGGIISIGLLVLIFLIKFIFASNKIDQSHLLEIKQSDEPELFKLIEDIVAKVNTSFPKKVYFSNDINASVFYDSNFWSMFFPVRKNLQIGLGLINSVNKTELKAILAHEFGHFSQKTMKVGSYVYNVNQVIFNLLYDNDSYNKLVSKFASISGFISYSVLFADKIIRGIKWILWKLYGVVNKQYLSLSREMEFHADEIAASITGGAALKSALLRLNFADHALNQVLLFYDGKISQNIVSNNVFSEHFSVMKHLADYNAMPFEGELPSVSLEELNRFNKSKLVIKDQWASHPSIEDRIARLDNFDFKVEQPSFELANSILSNAKETHQSQTKKILSTIEFTGEISSLPLDNFIQEYKDNFLKNSFAKIYNGYYDNKNPIVFNLDSNFSLSDITLKDLFSDQKVELVYTEIALKSDIETIKQIQNNTIRLKTFDYDGIKYKRSDAETLNLKLQKELEKVVSKIKHNDIQVFHFFNKIDSTFGNKSKLQTLYTAFFELDRNFDRKIEVYNKLHESINFLTETTPVDQIKHNLKLAATHETNFKADIKALIDNSTLEEELTPEILQNFNLYLEKEWQYFGVTIYHDENLNILYTAMNNYLNLLYRNFFIAKRNLLNYQIELAQNLEAQV